MAAKQTKPAGVAPVKQVQPVSTIDWTQYQTTGFEQTSQEDFGIPFLTIVQKGSPEVDKTHKDYQTKRIEDADVGDIINTISRQALYHHGDEHGVRIIPCSYQKVYAEWKPRESGGGFVRAHRNSDILLECTRNDKNQDVHKNGNLIVTTAYFFCLLVNADNTTEQVVISMTSTQLKKARHWLNMMNAIKVQGPKGKITPPMFSHCYYLTTTPENNDSGSWMGWLIEGGGMLSDAALIQEGASVAAKALSFSSEPKQLAAKAGDDLPI